MYLLAPFTISASARDYKFVWLGLQDAAVIFASDTRSCVSDCKKKTKQKEKTKKKKTKKREVSDWEKKGKQINYTFKCTNKKSMFLRVRKYRSIKYKKG